jgi:hypothetical protein
MPTSLLTLDVGGADEMDVAVSRAGHAEPREVGTRVFALLGRERSLIQQELFVLPFALEPVPQATMETIKRLFARGAQVPCAGLALNNGGATVTCSGELVPEMEQGTTYWLGTLTLSEVGSG